MPKKIVKTSYNSGEMAPLVDIRDDMAKYYNGCSKVVNGTVMVYGGVVKRSGTELITGAKGKCVLISFEFSVTDSHILEFGANYMRVFKNDAAVTITKASVANWVTSTSYSVNDMVYDSVGDTGYYYCDTAHTSGATFAGDSDNWTLMTASGTNNLIYEIYTPYSVTEVFEIHIVQSADVMYIAHDNHKPQKLSRIADDDWTIEDYDNTGGPFLTENAVTDDYLSVICGTHTGSDDAAVLTDSTQAWTADELIGYEFFNITDASHGTITDNTETTITMSGGLSGGTDNNIDEDDEYVILDGHYIPEGLKVTLKATGCTPFVTTDNVHVDSIWLLKHTRQDNKDSLEGAGNFGTGTQTSAEIKCKGDLTVSATGFSATAINTVVIERKEGDGKWQEHRVLTAATAYSTTEEADDVYYRCTLTGTGTGGETSISITAKDQINKGIVKLTATASTSSATATVVEPVYFDHTDEGAGDYSADDNKTCMWAEGAWSDYRGFPKTAAFKGGRLAFAGSTNNPQTIWFSKVGLYDDHAAGVLADDAFVMAIDDSDVSEIQWLSNTKKGLVAGTANKEYLISANNPEDAIKPTDCEPKFQSGYGSGTIQPRMLNDGLFYVQRQGRRIRIMRTNEYDNIKSDDAVILANHILDSSPTSVAVQKSPDSIVWVVREDGVLLSFVYDPVEKVAAWSRHITGNQASAILNGTAAPTDLFESVAVTHGTTEDEVWVSVKRGASRYIEKFSARYIGAEDEALMLDSAVVVEPSNLSQSIIYAADTVRYGSGRYGSGQYGAA